MIDPTLGSTERSPRHPSRNEEIISLTGGRVARLGLLTIQHSAFLLLVIRETPLHQCRERALARSCNTPFSALRRGLENHKCARRHAANGNTRNIRRVFRATGNTTYIR